MRYYGEHRPARRESRIAEEERLREQAENEHVRLCNAGVNQTHYVWKSEEERAEWNRLASEWMNGGFQEACRRRTEERRLRGEFETTG